MTVAAATTLISIIALIAILKHEKKGDVRINWKKNKKSEAYPYYEKNPLSKIEQVLYFRLINALPDHIVLAQVQLSRFLGVKQGFNNHEWNNKINRMSADYVVCRKDFSIIAIIELDDSSHDTPTRAKADKKKDESLNAAGIAVIRWHVKNMPDLELIKTVIKAHDANYTVMDKPN